MKSPSPEPSETKPYAPLFLQQTYQMVDDATTDHIVAWSGNDTFLIKDQNLLASEVLPRFFKHNNFSSFVRQLNGYGFRKISPETWHFKHEKFVRGEPQLLREMARRKTAKPPGSTSKQLAAPAMDHSFAVMTELENLRKTNQYLIDELMRMRQSQDDFARKVGADMEMLAQRGEQTRTQVNGVLSFMQAAYDQSRRTGVRYDDMPSIMPPMTPPQPTTPLAGSKRTLSFMEPVSQQMGGPSSTRRVAQRNETASSPTVDDSQARNKLGQMLKTLADAAAIQGQQDSQQQQQQSASGGSMAPPPPKNPVRKQPKRRTQSTPALIEENSPVQRPVGTPGGTPLPQWDSSMDFFGMLSGVGTPPPQLPQSLMSPAPANENSNSYYSGMDPELQMMSELPMSFM